MLSVVAELERSNDRLAWRVLRAERFRFGRSMSGRTKMEGQPRGSDQVS
jgi:hypothetical protein